MTIFQEIKQSYSQGTTLHKLIYINVGVFLLLHVGVIVLVLSNQIDRMQGINQILHYLAVPSDLVALSRRPWTVFTYMFTHGFLWHIVFNLLILFWFGKLFIAEFGLKKLTGIYILGGLAGAFLYILFYNIFPFFDEVKQQSVATGASASVMAILIAVATIAPNRQINLILIGPVKIVYVALVLFVTSTILDFTDNTGGKIAHLGGALVGFFFATYFKKGQDVTRGFDSFMDNMAGLFSRKKKMKVTHRRPANDYEYNKVKAEEQEEMDRILDKISKAGYDALTKSEKEKLFNMKN